MVKVNVPIASAAAGVAILALATLNGPGPDYGHPFGVTQNLNSPDGTVAAYTVRDIGPSVDPIPVTGRLFEATVSVLAAEGDVMPKVPLFSARTNGGQLYPALSGLRSPAALSQDMLRPGERATGRIYFDVTDDTPTSVVCNNGFGDVMVWKGVPDTTPRSIRA